MTKKTLWKLVFDQVTDTETEHRNYGMEHQHKVSLCCFAPYRPCYTCVPAGHIGLLCMMLFSWITVFLVAINEWLSVTAELFL